MAVAISQNSAGGMRDGGVFGREFRRAGAQIVISDAAASIAAVAPGWDGKGGVGFVIILARQKCLDGNSLVGCGFGFILSLHHYKYSVDFGDFADLTFLLFNYSKRTPLP